MGMMRQGLGLVVVLVDLLGLMSAMARIDLGDVRLLPHDAQSDIELAFGALVADPDAGREAGLVVME